MKNLTINSRGILKSATNWAIYPGPKLGKPVAAVTGTTKVALQKSSTRAKNLISKNNQYQHKNLPFFIMTKAVQRIFQLPKSFLPTTEFESYFNYFSSIKYKGREKNSKKQRCDLEMGLTYHLIKDDSFLQQIFIQHLLRLEVQWLASHYILFLPQPEGGQITLQGPHLESRANNYSHRNVMVICGISTFKVFCAQIK